MSSQPSDRAQQLLKLIVEHYIESGQPVASKTLAENKQLSISPATIRNIMADLEEHGFLCSPHTSAGRIPTDQGYRFFINSLLTVQPLNHDVVESLKGELKNKSNEQALLQASTSLLSNITQLAGLVTLPKYEKFILRQVEFLSLSANRILIILVFNEKEVQNRIIHTDRVFSASELEQAGNYMTQHFAGCDLRDVRDQLLRVMQRDRAQISDIFQAVSEVVDQAFTTPEPEKDYWLDGYDHLIAAAGHETGIERLSSLFSAFNQKRDMLALLDKCLLADGVQIFIGEESGYNQFQGCSLITAPYKVDGNSVGVVGVIGPSRMAYDRVIPMVDISAKLLSAALN